MVRRTQFALRCTSLWLLAGCASVPVQAPDAEQRLADAEAQLTAGDGAGALDRLDAIAGEICPQRLRDRRDVAMANAHYANGELWEAFLALEHFSDLYPHSELRPTVVEKLWLIGEALARSDRGFLFFWSDATAGRTVLEHLITRHPDTPRLGDALRILGDMAFADENYELAQQRFRDLMLNRPESEWYGYAQYRFAMSIVASLEGPDYDLDRMQHATRELRDFLRTPPENPEIVANAEATISRLLAWQVERHLRIVDFYRTLGNVPGQLRHLDLVAAPEFAGAPRYLEAMAMRNDLRAAQSVRSGAKP